MAITTEVKVFNEAMQKHFQELKVKTILYPEDIEKDFNGDIEYFYRFMKEEVEYWSFLSGGGFTYIQNYFRAVVDQLNQAVSYQDSNVNHAQGLIVNAINKMNEANNYRIYSSTAVAQFLKEQCEKNTTQGISALNYLIENSTNSITNKEYFKGIMNSYVWEEQDHTFNPKLTAHKKALTQLKSTFSKDRDELYGDFKMKHREVSDTYKAFKDELEAWRNEISVSTKEYVDHNQNELSQFVLDKQAELIELESLYQQKLMLEAPATYWDELSKHYNAQGNQWRLWAIVATSILSTVLLSILFWKPETIFEGNHFTANSIKASLLLVLFTSIAIYLIRLFVLLAQSAYHLSRDAKERYQLTYVYLALIKEKGASEAERSIILQALFSRADTGLLKGDSSPAMPDGMLSQIMKNIGAPPK
ncbi:DUF6161 domain-containing protein [Brevibacillus sp. FIR094]|uniref:DUF6161 domain-containing protein n=1 Tax=Brevibacillus sp. FIR094 TaxID=3134809 RepID=UPI003D1D95B9